MHPIVAPPPKHPIMNHAPNSADGTDDTPLTIGIFRTTVRVRVRVIGLGLGLGLGSESGLVRLPSSKKALGRVMGGVRARATAGYRSLASYIKL